MSDKKITQEKYLQLAGLTALAKTHYDRLREIERSMADVLDAEGRDDGYYGHISDSVWSDHYPVDTLLEKMSIDVEDAD